MHITIEAGLECTFSNTAASVMHVLLTRLACTFFDTVDTSWQHHSVNSTDTSTSDPEIPDYKMLTRAGNVVWRHTR
jgi:hypothetical protein